ncbi:hypothetical protein DINM_002971 [Dirofilaria immitis]|nr:hypothetical protein [Dirofilaria immitis]
MAADVCAEQLPSTSYATTAAISSSSTSSVMKASQTLIKVATSTTFLLGSCCMSQSVSSINYQQQDDEAAFTISLLPPEIYLYILKHLPRYDIDNCRFVCKRWKEMIDRNIHLLRKHLVQILELREYKSQFILTLNCLNLSKSWTFCDHITNRPSFGLGKRRRSRISTTHDNNARQQQEWHNEDEQQFQRSAAKLPHLLIYMRQASPPDSYLPVLMPNVSNDNNWHTEDHDERKRREHTPSQLLCERIAKYFHEADIHLLRLTEMRFTDRFIDRLLEAFRTCKIRCKKVEISMCKLNYVSPKKTVLRIDNSSITTNGLYQAIDKWKQTSTRWILNLCLGSEDIDIDELLRNLSLNQNKPRQGAFRIVHPQLPDEALLLWDDKDGLHIVSSGKTIT